MRILLASSAFYPEKSPRSFRATELAKEFTKNGHEVTLLTLPYGSVTESFCQRHSIRLKYVSRRRWRNFQIGGNAILALLRRALNRLFLMMFEYPDVELSFAYRKALIKEDGYDLLISFAVPYPVHWGVAAVRDRKHRIADIWIADCGDPYFGDRSDSFRKWFYFRWIERWMFSRVDFISVPHELARQAYFPDLQKKIRVIPQGVNVEELKLNLLSYQSNEIVTFAYAGTFMPGTRDPRAFLAYVLSMDIDFRFHIYTRTPGLIQGLVDKSRGRLIVHDYLPRQELIGRLSTMDFLVNFGNTSTTQVPSKLIDYAIAARPVLEVPSGSVNQLTLHQFLSGDYTGKSIVDIQPYRIEKVAGSFIELCHESR